MFDDFDLEIQADELAIILHLEEEKESEIDFF